MSDELKALDKELKARIAALGRTYWLPVNEPKHTEVLGYRVSTEHGKHLWDELDWDNWWPDGPGAHLFNSGGMYFHVECKDKDEGCVYRVRCFYAGRKYRGREVREIDIGMKGGKLHWIVRCEAQPTPTRETLKGGQA